MGGIRVVVSSTAERSRLRIAPELARHQSQGPPEPTRRSAGSEYAPHAECPCRPITRSSAATATTGQAVDATPAWPGQLSGPDQRVETMVPETVGTNSATCMRGRFETLVDPLLATPTPGNPGRFTHSIGDPLHESLPATSATPAGAAGRRASIALTISR